VIQLQDISYIYPGSERPALDRVSFALPRGQWLAVLGPTAAGKTTLCKLVKGILHPTAGSITRDFPAHSDHGRMGFLGGDPLDWFVGLTVEEEVVFGLENACFPHEEIRERLETSLHTTGLAGKERRLVHTLSGGEQQRLALCAALAAGCDFLIIDEALTMVERTVRAQLRSLLAELRLNQGLTILEVMQSVEDLLSVDRVLFLNEGHVVTDQDAKTFLEGALGRAWAKCVGGIGAVRAALRDYGIQWDGNEFISRLGMHRSE
jgi:energy-coupling factor transport system ATP-binding protein